MMPAALASGWFLLLLAQLRDTHPWIEPWVHTSEQTEVPEEAEIDIVLGPLPWPAAGAQSVLLAEDALIPLCAPKLAASLPDVADRARLDCAPLLHDETLNDWQSWFKAAGSARTEFSRGDNFSNTGLMLQAAQLGLGVCLATAREADRALRDGHLVQACHADLTKTIPLFMSCWTRNLTRPPVQALWDWLRSAGDPETQQAHQAKP